MPKRKTVLREIDKLDKIGAAKVRESLVSLGLDDAKADKLLQLVSLQGTKDEILDALREMPAAHPVFIEGREDVIGMVAALRALGVPEERTRINLAIARGLDYYTGTVYETLIDAHPNLVRFVRAGDMKTSRVFIQNRNCRGLVFPLD